MTITTNTPALTYGDRVKLLRLLASATAELRQCRDLLARSQYDDLHDVVMRAHTRTGTALRVLVAFEETALTPADAALLDPTIKRALAALDATVQRHCERERNDATGRVEGDDAAALERWAKL